MADTLKITILKDGTIKTESESVSEVNHDSAERFLRSMSKLAGGETIRERRTNAPHEHHHHHDEEKHSHH